jgi:hypothetical protein
MNGRNNLSDDPLWYKDAIFYEFACGPSMTAPATASAISAYARHHKRGVRWAHSCISRSHRGPFRRIPEAKYVNRSHSLPWKSAFRINSSHRERLRDHRFRWRTRASASRSAPQAHGDARSRDDAAIVSSRCVRSARRSNARPLAPGTRLVLDGILGAALANVGFVGLSQGIPCCCRRLALRPPANGAN